MGNLTQLIDERFFIMAIIRYFVFASLGNWDMLIVKTNPIQYIAVLHNENMLCPAYYLWKIIVLQQTGIDSSEFVHI